MTPDSTCPDGSNAQAAMVEASRLMQQGLGLVAGDPTREAAGQALDCFDRALELRRRLPVEQFPVLRYDLAACWLNRAETLVRFEDAARIALAVEAYDEAIGLLSSLPLAQDARFSRRLAVAHQNRGLALQAQGRRSQVAICSFLDAIAVLEHEDAAQVADRHYLLAAATVNLAKALMSESTPHAGVLARQAALRALELVKDLEGSDADAALVGLTARHLICQVIAARGLPNPAGPGPAGDDVHEATDLADEGLGLIRRWEQQGIGRFRGLAADLFRFGAQVYGLYQPHFLKEFVCDQIDPVTSSPDYVNSAEMRAVARHLHDLAMWPAAAVLSTAD